MRLTSRPLNPRIHHQKITCAFVKCYSIIILFPSTYHLSGGLVARTIQSLSWIDAFVIFTLHPPLALILEAPKLSRY